MGDLRQTGRFQSAGKVTLSWIDRQGHSCTVNGECLDISEGGIRVRMKLALDVRTYVTVKFTQAKVHGSASVRCCIRKRMDYVAGLQFTGGMKITREMVEASTSVAD